MNIRDAVLQQGVEVLLVDSFKVLPGNPLHDGVIHAVPPSGFNVNAAYIGSDGHCHSPDAGNFLAFSD
jgi:hypothetical protein